MFFASNKRESLNLIVSRRLSRTNTAASWTAIRQSAVFAQGATKPPMLLRAFKNANLAETVLFLPHDAMQPFTPRP